jgi:hypothetical protein
LKFIVEESKNLFPSILLSSAMLLCVASIQRADFHELLQRDTAEWDVGGLKKVSRTGVLKNLSIYY